MLSLRIAPSRLPLAKVSHLLRRLGYVAFLVSLVALIAALGAAVLPRLAGYGTLVVRGGSMGEAYPTGSLVVSRSMAAKEVRVGDAILVGEENAAGKSLPTLHRVVSLSQQGDQIVVQTKGDANETADPNLYVLNGRVATPVYTLPYLGYLLGFVLTQLGWVLVVAIPATILSLLMLRSIWSDEEGSSTTPVTT